MFFWVQNFAHLYWTLSVIEFPFGTSEAFFFFHIRPFKKKTILPPGVSLRQIQFVVILMSSEGKLSPIYLILLLVYY